MRIRYVQNVTSEGGIFRIHRSYWVGSLAVINIDYLNEMYRAQGGKGDSAIRIHSDSFVAIRIHSHPFLAIRIHSQPFVAIRIHSQPFVAIRTHSNGSECAFPPCVRSSKNSDFCQSFWKTTMMPTFSRVGAAGKVVENQKFTLKCSIRNELKMYLVVKKGWNKFQNGYGFSVGN